MLISGAFSHIRNFRIVMRVIYVIVSHLKEDCSDLHEIYILYLYKFVYFCMLKLAIIFLIKQKKPV